MRRIIFGVLFLIPVLSYAIPEVKSLENKGEIWDSYTVYVSTYGVKREGQTIFTATTSIVALENTNLSVIYDYEYEVDENGADIFTASHTAITAVRAIGNPRPRMPGRTYSPQGKVDNPIVYGKMKEGLTGYTTVYVDAYGK